MQKLTIFSIIFFLSIFNVVGQIDSCWTVLVVKKGITPDYSTTFDGKFNQNGFYLYRNCVYEIDLKDEQKIRGRLIDITKDTLSFTNYFNQNVTMQALSKLDTFRVHYRELDKLNLFSINAKGLYEKYSFDNFDFIFKKDTANCILESDWKKIYTNDDKKYEIVSYLTAKGIDLLYVHKKGTSFYEGKEITKPDSIKKDSTYNKKYVIWVTPCSVEEINGIAIGPITENTKNIYFGSRDSLIIRGLNFEINPFAIFVIFYPKFNGSDPDSINIYYKTLKKHWDVKIIGSNISLVNTISEMEIRGFNFASLFTLVNEVHGVTISGINNFCYILNGVSIAGFRNRATFAKGLQIGLFNKATDMRGIQIGLWNTNAKRSLPLINWQFKEKKHKIQHSK